MVRKLLKNPPCRAEGMTDHSISWSVDNQYLANTIKEAGKSAPGLGRLPIWPGNRWASVGKNTLTRTGPSVAGEESPGEESPKCSLFNN